MRASVRLLLIASVVAAATAGTVLPAANATKAAPYVRGNPWVLHEWIPDGPPLELLVVRQDGTGLHRLMDPSPVPGADIQHGDWSPDGRSVAFEVLRPDGSASVWTVRADGRGARERVVCSAVPCLQIAYPAWSPDGRSLLVVRYDVADNGDWADNWLEVVNVRTGVRRAIARIPGDQSFYRPRWSPDASKVVVEIDSYTDATQSELTGASVAVVDVRSGLASAPVPITPAGMFAANPDWHPYLPLITFGTNDPVTFRSSTAPSNIYTVLPNGRWLRKVTGSVDGALRFGQPTFTPDGLRISLVVARTAGGTRVASWRPALIGLLGGPTSEIGVSGFWPKVAPRAS
jgi:Tol biopolymer transport system component